MDNQALLADKEQVLLDGRLDIPAMAMALSHRLGIAAAELQRQLAWTARKAPPGEARDMLQQLCAEWLKELPTTPQLAYGIARLSTAYYWRRWRIRNHTSLESSIEGPTPLTQLQEALVAGVAWEIESCGQLDAQQAWKALPARVQAIVQGRLNGLRTGVADRKFLERWIKGTGAAAVYKLLTK